MTYDPLTDDLLVAVEAAQARAGAAKEEDGHRLSLLLSGFDLNPVLMAELVSDMGKSHTIRLKAGADTNHTLQNLFVSGLLIGLFVGEVRRAREIAAGRAA